MKKFILLFCLPFSVLNAQYVETFNNEHSIGFGFGNTIGVITNFISSTNILSYFEIIPRHSPIFLKRIWDVHMGWILMVLSLTRILR